MNLKDTQHPILFNLPYTISNQDQIKILDYAYQHANSWSGQVQVWDEKKDTYDQTDYFGRIQITRLTESSIKKVTADTSMNSNWLNWVCRLDPTLDWEWIETPITTIVKNYVDSIQHLYKKFNRALILVQKQGSAIPLHTDKVVKNSYSDEYFAPGPSKDIKIEVNNNHYIQNRHLTLKFPLTEIKGNNGSPLIEIDKSQYFYNASDKLFAINEVDIKHGANAVSHRRGVIFLDGLLNYEALLKEQWLDIGLTKCNF